MCMIAKCEANNDAELAMDSHPYSLGSPRRIFVWYHRGNSVYIRYYKSNDVWVGICSIPESEERGDKEEMDLLADESYNLAEILQWLPVDAQEYVCCWLGTGRAIVSIRDAKIGR
jgi:hypothetical protein